MKACKKCKKHVANKAKICKYCGNDVSKAKIIKTEPKKEIEKTTSKSNELIIEDKTYDKPITINEEKYIFIEEVNTDLIMKRRKKLNKKQRIIKLAVISLIILSVLSIGLYFGIKLFSGSEKVIEVDRIKDSKKKIYDMGTSISYKDVIYKVTKVEVSQGNNYFKPKKDNQYVVVHLEIINKSKDKIEYSYDNWKLNNSNDEEASRIFVAVNVGTALYNGELPMSARKTGSIVFEQPIADENLILRFYELEEKEEDEEQQEEKKKQKPIFEIKIKTPKAKEE